MQGTETVLNEEEERSPYRASKPSIKRSIGPIPLILSQQLFLNMIMHFADYGLQLFLAEQERGMQQGRRGGPYGREVDTVWPPLHGFGLCFALSMPRTSNFCIFVSEIVGLRGRGYIRYVWQDVLKREEGRGGERDLFARDFNRGGDGQIV